MTALAAYFPLVPGGKTPAVAQWEQTAPGAFPPVGNHGRALTPEDLVLDADPRNYPDGRNVLKEIWELHRLPQTRVVKTPRGGYHLCYKKPPGFKPRRKQTLFPGIDFLTAGAYVVEPGSVTPDGRYELVMDVEPAELPASLLAVLEQYAEAVESGAEVSLQQFDRYKIECECAAPAIEGQHGDDATYAMAIRGRELALPKECTYQLMRDYWNPRCQPPWDEGDLWKKVCNAYRYARNAPGAATPEAKFLAEHAESNVISIETYQNDLVVAGIHADTLTLNRANNIQNTLSNVVYLLRHDPAWRGRIKHNQFSSNYEFSGRPDWRKAKLNEGVEITKHDRSCMQAWFSSAGHVRLEVSEDKLKAAISAAAIPYHPVLDYLNNLIWDGKPRLDTILVDTAGAEDNLYTRAVGRCLLLAAVKRIFEPGCKHDYVPVLEGKQGKFKSTWIAVLGGQWYSASELVRGDKDTYQNLRGRWFVELPEINATFRKADFAWLKGIITNPIDVYRASYGDASKGVPRESVFVGSINPNAGGEYLKDDENRRYWPVKTGTFDIHRLRRDRDQYFAEAVHRYRQGEPIWMADEVVQELARREQFARQEKNGYQDVLADWLVHREQAGILEITPAECYRVCGYQSAKEITSSAVRASIAQAMRNLGYDHVPGCGAGTWTKKVMPTKWGDLL